MDTLYTYGDWEPRSTGKYTLAHHALGPGLHPQYLKVHDALKKKKDLMYVCVCMNSTV